MGCNCSHLIVTFHGALLLPSSVVPHILLIFFRIVVCD
uniref:Uncharacterized protein n=1 Tax=Arundo donax TaxID=35708 RepID=A0A0A8XZK5_ARUDO